MKTSISFLLLTAVALFFTQTAFPQSVGFDIQNGQAITNTGDNSTESSVFFECTIESSPTQYPMSLDQYTILYAAGGVYNSKNTGTFVYDFNLAPGTYTFKVDYYELLLGYSTYEKTASASVTFYVKHTISVTNDFGSGHINVDNYEETSGFQAYKFTGNGLNVGAIDQTDGSGSQWIWNTNGINNSNWYRRPMAGNYSALNGATGRNYLYTVASNDNGATIMAGLREICHITFQNNFTSVGNGGVIDVNSAQYNSPTSSFNVTQQNPISASAVSQSINGINYNFSSWSNGSSSSSTTFYPNDNTTYTANFTGTPDNSNLNFGFDLTVGQPIKMHWTDNPNSNVVYQIWRATENSKGQPVNPVQIGTVQPGIQTFSDDNYTYMGSRSTTPLFYDVTEYYQVEGTSSNKIWHSTRGSLLPKGSTPLDSTAAGEIKNYSLTCYPNPFNPTTRINYQLPKNEFVSLKVFDVVGKLVKTLVNGYRTAGSYTVTFNASNLPSGIYFYRIKTNDYFKVKKMLMIK